MMASDTTIRTAQAADAADLAALWDTAFDHQLTPDQWLVDPDRLTHTLVAVDGDGVCGSIWGLPKHLRESDGATALVHCIGSVAVAERSRGQGLARRLVAASLASAADADWALLFTGTPDVYRSNGFTTFELRGNLAGAWQQSRSPMSDAALEVTSAPVSEGVFGPVRAVYEASRAGVSIAPVRSDLDWAMAEVRLSGAQLHIVRRGADVLGYAVSGTKRRAGAQVGSILEIGVAPTAERDEGVWRALFESIARTWTAAGVTECVITAVSPAEGSAAQRALRSFAPQATYTADSSGMTRPLRREPRLGSIRHLTAADYF